MSDTSTWAPVYDGDVLLMDTSKVKMVGAACISVLLLAILDINIVSAVAWKMVSDLDPVHGISDLPWLTSCYALADCIVVPLYGKLADVYGTKPLLLVALGFFTVGSFLCGIAQSLNELIVFRTIQGLGAGGLTAITLVVTGILFNDQDDEGDPDRTVKPSAAVGVGAAIMFGLGMALGPTLGGLIADSLNWRWVFLLNLPILIAAFVVFTVVLKMPYHPVRRKVDFLGAALIGGFGACALLVAEWGGAKYAWSSTTIVGLTAGAVLLLAAFIWRSFTAPEPLVSLALMRNSVFRAMMPVSLVAGIGVAGGLLYISGYLQVGRGLSTGRSGLLIMCMAVGILASVPVAKVIVNALGKFKYLLVAAGVFEAVVMISFGWLGPDTSYWLIGAGCFVLGVGIGQSLGLGLQYMQSSVDLADLGVATTSMRFCQQLGTSFGFALYSTIVARYLNSHLTGTAGAANVDGNLDTDALKKLPADQYHSAVNVFINGTNVVFIVAGVLSLAAGLLALVIREKGYKKNAGDGAPASSSGLPAPSPARNQAGADMA
uniref:SsfR n=1 Tax=Streptomyces sp. SF2575 TaxID=746675 RepID=D6MSW3_9ACTN|nr:SsfR [Streptomyces sp. SF2575]